MTPVALTITADSKTKLYGAALPTLTASYSGFVNGDTAGQPDDAADALTTTATAASHVSAAYPITASGAVDADYTISYVAGHAFGDAGRSDDHRRQQDARLYGAALPTLTVSYSGFVNGDTAASLTTPPMLDAPPATATSHVGQPYPITASGAVDADYTISLRGRQRSRSRRWA